MTHSFKHAGKTLAIVLDPLDPSMYTLSMALGWVDMFPKKHLMHFSRHILKQLKWFCRRDNDDTLSSLRPLRINLQGRKKTYSNSSNYACHTIKDNTVNRLNKSIGFIVIDR